MHGFLIFAALAALLGTHLTHAHQPHWPDEVCKAPVFKLYLEDRKELWAEEKEVYREHIILLGQRTHAFGLIRIGKKNYSIPADQYAMLEHCFSYRPE